MSGSLTFDLLLLLGLGLTFALVWSLRYRVKRVESKLEPLARVRAEVSEMHRLMQQTLMHHQEWLVELKTDIVISNEQVREALDTLSRRLPCLAPDPVIPCAGDKEDGA